MANWRPIHTLINSVLAFRQLILTLFIFTLLISGVMRQLVKTSHIVVPDRIALLTLTSLQLTQWIPQ